jgi:hypothetical protein
MVLGMDGAIPLLLLHAFMEWTGITFNCYHSSKDPESHLRKCESSATPLSKPQISELHVLLNGQCYKRINGIYELQRTGGLLGLMSNFVTRQQGTPEFVPYVKLMDVRLKTTS